MKFFSQIWAVTLLNLKSIPQRLGASLVSVFGVAAVVLVFAAVLSMAKGFEKTMIGAGSDDTAIVLRGGATSELSSSVSREQVNIISTAPGVAKADDQPLLSAELYVLGDVPKKATGDDVNVPLRGVQMTGLDARGNVEIVEGRMFEPGKLEFVVGRAAQEQLAGLDVGSTIRFGSSEWQVVGVFDAQGGVTESELWTDVRVLQDVYSRGSTFQSVRVKLESPEALNGFKAALDSDPRLESLVYNEKEFYATQSEGLTRLIRQIGYPLTIVMAIGAVFGALNTMYSSVSARGKEIATLRSLGFQPTPILISTLIESTVLAVAGGLIGCLFAYVLFNGYQVSTLNGVSFSQVIFNFAVTPSLLVQGLVAALIIGLVGGLFPAIRAVSVPVNIALREL